MMPVTIQELLWQTSGIRDYIELAAMSGHQLGDSVTTKDLLDMLARSAGLDTTYWVCRTTGGLVARHVFGPDARLDPVAHDRFAGSFWWFHTASFSRDSSDRIVSMSASGFRGASDVTFIRTGRQCN
jgi:hypothetical protein